MSDPVNLESLLPRLPSVLVAELQKNWQLLQRAFSEGRHENVELAGGKICEALMRVLEWFDSGRQQYTPLNKALPNFEKQARGFEGKAELADSLRFHVPQVMTAVYTMRNRRGSSHVGSEVDPNLMDGRFVLSAVGWLLAELVRLENVTSPEQAGRAIEQLTRPKVPLVWETGASRRILDNSLSHKDQMMALLYSNHPRPVSERDLVEWIEASNPSVFRRDVIRPAHRARLVEYNQEARTVQLSPAGLVYVETKIELWAA